MGNCVSYPVRGSLFKWCNCDHSCRNTLKKQIKDSAVPKRAALRYDAESVRKALTRPFAVKVDYIDNILRISCEWQFLCLSVRLENREVNVEMKHNLG